MRRFSFPEQQESFVKVAEVIAPRLSSILDCGGVGYKFRKNLDLRYPPVLYVDDIACVEKHWVGRSRRGKQ